MDGLGLDQYEQFRRAVLEATGVSFCTRLHFGTPLPGERERYVRFSYSGIELDMIAEGLARLRDFVERSASRARVHSA
jgi:aspartate/methionine/tyrosine aminotransferase